MCANGVPTSLMRDIFHEAVDNIKGMRGRVKAGKTTKEDFNMMGICTEVRQNACLGSPKADDAQFPLTTLIKAGFHKDPMVLDTVEIIECRALQDLKWRARVKLPGGVFLIGQ
jgi:RNA-dependent RNA polymerase